MNARFIVTMGLPASGKTTWANRFVAQDYANHIGISRDGLRAMFHNSVFQGYTTEAKVVTAEELLIIEFIVNGMNVVVHDTNLTPSAWRQMLKLSKSLSVSVQVVDFTNIPLDVCIERDSKREGVARVGRDVICRMYDDYCKHAKFIRDLLINSPQQVHSYIKIEHGPTAK